MGSRNVELKNAIVEAFRDADVPDDAGNGIFAELPGIRERTQD